MSRSYKKHHCYRNGSGRKPEKRMANRMIHNAKEVKSGNYYKKVSIRCECRNYYIYGETLMEVMNEYLERGKNIQDAYAYWIKTYYYK